MLETLRRVEALLREADTVQANRQERLTIPELQELGGLITRISGMTGKLAARAADDTWSLTRVSGLRDADGENPEPTIRKACRALAGFTESMNAVIGNGAIFHQEINKLPQTTATVPMHFNEFRPPC